MSWLSDLLGRLFGGGRGPIEEAAHIRPIGVGDESPAVELVQSALIKAGHVIVPDGGFGQLTEAAVRAFQAANHLPVTGVVEEHTARALDKSSARAAPPPAPSGSVLAAAPWLANMRAITGTREVPGDANSPIIMSWKGDIARAFPEMAAYANSYPGDATAWCGWGLGWCCATATPRKVRPPFGPSDTQRFMYARSWAPPNWGVKLERPLVGCIMTFIRSGGGHVGLLEGQNSTHFWIRGCNQSDMVNVSKRPRDSSFLAAAWPKEYPVVENLTGVMTDAVPSGSEA